MAGTREGGLKAAAKNIATDPNFYARIGKRGGSRPTNRPKGFAYMAEHDPKKFRLVSRKGGIRSNRT